MTADKPAYQDEVAPVGKIRNTLTYSARRALMSASKTNGSTNPAWLIAIQPPRPIRAVRAFLSNGMDQQEADDKHDMEANVQASDGS
jgi:hypothetical protein